MNCKAYVGRFENFIGNNYSDPWSVFGISQWKYHELKRQSLRSGSRHSLNWWIRTKVERHKLPIHSRRVVAVSDAPEILNGLSTILLYHPMYQAQYKRNH